MNDTILQRYKAKKGNVNPNRQTKDTFDGTNGFLGFQTYELSETTANVRAVNQLIAELNPQGYDGKHFRKDTIAQEPDSVVQASLNGSDAEDFFRDNEAQEPAVVQEETCTYVLSSAKTSAPKKGNKIEEKKEKVEKEVKKDSVETSESGRPVRLVALNKNYEKYDSSSRDETENEAINLINTKATSTNSKKSTRKIYVPLSDSDDDSEYKVSEISNSDSEDEPIVQITAPVEVHRLNGGDKEDILRDNEVYEPASVNHQNLNDSDRENHLRDNEAQVPVPVAVHRPNPNSGDREDHLRGNEIVDRILFDQQNPNGGEEDLLRDNEVYEPAPVNHPNLIDGDRENHLQDDEVQDQAPDNHLNHNGDERQDHVHVLWEYYQGLGVS